MNEKEALLRKIPKVDELLVRLNSQENDFNHSHLIGAEAVREVLSGIRSGILAGDCTEILSLEGILELIKIRITENTRPRLRRVINATGTILHTNMGRSKLSQRALDSVVDAARSYSNLEYDIKQGKRGSRNAHVEELIVKLLGVESALVVNNNAAAVLLILSSVAKDKEVIISRGESVEIGGSFRIPSVMKQSGGALVEVGTTNKTYARDYESAIDAENTAALLKVHTSNFRIVGFSVSATVKELADLANEHDIPLIHDIGSGILTNLSEYGIVDEPTVHQSVADGADIICFSGDKLLGGPQAGIIVGKKKYIDLMKKNQLARALRIDKLTLAALEGTLRSYIEGTAEKDIPTLKMLTVGTQELEEKADILSMRIKAMVKDCNVEAIEEYSQVGGGSVPGQMLPTFVVTLQPDKLSVAELERCIRLCDTPIVGRVSKNRLLLDVRTLDADDFKYIAHCIAECLNA